MKFSDIQINDRELWTRIKNTWESGNYSAVLAILADAQLQDKGTTAKVLNDMTNRIVGLERQYKPKDIIKVLREPPKSIEVGKVYFDWTNLAPYIFFQVDELLYTFKDIDGLGINWSRVDKGGW